MKKKKNNVLLIIACVLSYLSVLIAVVSAVFLAFNIAGIADIYKQMLLTYVSKNIDVTGQITMNIVELGLGALLNLYFASYYLKGIRYKVDNKQFGRMLINQAIFQMLLAGLLPGLFALLAGNAMCRKTNKVSTTIQDGNAYMSEYKMEAMSEAVRRLKELKAQGAISEEEYYASLNKILES